MSVRSCCRDKHSHSPSPKSLKSQGRSSKAKSMPKVLPERRMNIRSQSIINIVDLNKKLAILNNMYLCQDVQ
jgi:hypothetical protein